MKREIIQDTIVVTVQLEAVKWNTRAMYLLTMITETGYYHLFVLSSKVAYLNWPT